VKQKTHARQTRKTGGDGSAEMNAAFAGALTRSKFSFKTALDRNLNMKHTRKHETG
jgi:hypothetical protein